MRVLAKSRDNRGPKSRAALLPQLDVCLCAVRVCGNSEFRIFGFSNSGGDPM